MPVIVREADDRAVLELALIENLQRENLNPIEEAQGYSQLVEQFQLTQEEVATKVGKSRVVVANALRLLKLPPAIQSYIRDGRLSVGHAKVILGLTTDKPHQKLAAERVIKEGLNVRQTEGLVAKLQARTNGRHAASRDCAAARGCASSPISRTACANDWARRCISATPTGKGALEISFFSDPELERILQILGVTLNRAAVVRLIVHHET